MEHWVTSIVESTGYAGVLFLMFLENLFPPIPSEVVMPLSGYTAARAGHSIVGVIIAGTAGSVLGAIFWYWVARRLGEERLKRWARRHGRWITLGPSDIDRADDWFDRYGAWVVFFGRLVPTIRTLVAIPAGLFEMPFWRYVVLTTLGSAIWTGGLALVGWYLGNRWDEVSDWIDPFAHTVVAVVVVIYLWRVVTFERSERKAEERRDADRR